MRQYTRQDVTPINSAITGREFGARNGRGINGFVATEKSLKSLKNMGIFYDEAQINAFYQQALTQRKAVAFDAVTLTPSITPATTPTPIQFLQAWAPGQVTVATQVRRGDAIMGYTNLGRWSDQQVVQVVVEMLGNTVPYLDYSDNVYATYNPSYNPRTIIRLQIGLTVSRLESERAASGMLDDAGWKRKSAAYNLEITRNLISFNGFNSGSGGTYGFLNAPEMNNYVNVAGGTWASAAALVIQNQLLTAFAALRASSGGNLDPVAYATTLVVPTNCMDFLRKSSDYGWSTFKWLKENYPLCRVIDAPQLQNAYLNSNVFYLFGDSMQDDPYSTDGNETWLAGGPTKLMLLGTEQNSNGFQERYSNATFGAMCKRPFLVVRYYGI